MSQQFDKLLKQFEGKETLVVGGLSFLAGLTGGIIFKTNIRSLLRKTGLLKQGGAFAGMNSAKAGARSQKQLERGQHPYQLYSLGTPNGQKVTIFLEEAGLPYDAWVINIMNQEQFTSGFVDINPNSKIPALVDYSENKEKGQRVFESGNILLHLAEKTGKFIPKDPSLRTECLNLLFFQVGSGPYIGQFGHFFKYAPRGIFQDHEYGILRYKQETQRLLSVLDQLLEKRTYLVGEEYTIADMAWYPWVDCIRTGYMAEEEIQLKSYKNIARWMQLLEQREGVQKGKVINQTWKGNKDHHSKL